MANKQSSRGKIRQNLRNFFTRRRRLKTHLFGILQAGVVAGIIGMVYMAMVYGPLPDDLAQAFFTCFCIGCLCLVFETFVFEAMLKRISSYKVFVLRFFWYQACLLLSFSLGIALFNQVGLSEAYAAIASRDKMVAGWAVVAFNFVILVNRWMGHKALWIFFKGTYNQPIFEERLLLFLKINWNQDMQEEREFEHHHEKLQRFIEIATDPILETGGQIYRYEPDGILVTYEKDAFESVLDCVLLLDSYYKQHFQAGLSLDKLSIAETGDFKKEILILSALFGSSMIGLRQRKDRFLVHRRIYDNQLKKQLAKAQLEYQESFDQLGYTALTWEQLANLRLSES